MEVDIFTEQTKMKKMFIFMEHKEYDLLFEG